MKRDFTTVQVVETVPATAVSVSRAETKRIESKRSEAQQRNNVCDRTVSHHQPITNGIDSLFDEKQGMNRLV